MFDYAATAVQARDALVDAGGATPGATLVQSVPGVYNAALSKVGAPTVTRTTCVALLFDYDLMKAGAGGDGGQGVTIRAGWSHPPLTAPGVVAEQAPAHEAVAVKTGITDAEMQKAMAALETRLRAEIGTTAQRPAAPAAVPVSFQGSAVDRGELLQQVRNLVDESERRQQRELALRLAQVVQDVENQRRTDLVKIEQNFGQIESLTSQEAAHQRAITNYLVRASQRQ